MARFEGKIARGNQIILKHITVEITEHQSISRSAGTSDPSTIPGPRSWGGWFRLPRGEFIDRGNYRLILADGRSGDIVVFSAPVGGSLPTMVQFRGVGRLV